MFRKNIRISAFILMLIILISTLSSGAIALDNPNRDYAPRYSAEIGIVNYPIIINGDGSFSFEFGGETISASFPVNSESDFEYCYSGYPVVSQRFTEGKVSVALSQFAKEIQIGNEKSVAVYSKVTVKNDSKKEYEFAGTMGNAILMGEENGDMTVKAGKEKTFEYCTSASAAVATEGTFDSKLAETTVYWDTLLSEGFGFTSFTGEKSGDEYVRRIINSMIDTSFENGDVCLETALSILQGKAVESTKAIVRAKEISTEITKLSGENMLILTDGTPLLSDNLNALVSLRSAAYICRALGDSANEKIFSLTYTSLEESVARVLENTVARLSAAWQVADTDGSTDNLLFALNSEESAASLCRWYTCTGIMSGANSQYLSEMAEESFKYSDDISYIDAMAPAVISVSETGYLTVGRACPDVLLTEGGEISFEKYIIDETTVVDGTISCNENEIKLTLSKQSPLPVVFELPVFKNGIEYASSGYDYSTGIVTAPAGTSEITVRLIENVSDIINENAGTKTLEKALFEASLRDKENCTAPSLDAFNSAYDNAVAARAGTAEGKIAAAEDLVKATLALSKLSAGYTFKISEDKYSGTVSSDAVMQKFTIGSEGTLESVTVSGTYEEGVFAAIYTLRKDGYTTDQLVYETDGKATDKGYVFNFDAQVEKNGEYVLCIYNETKPVSLNVLCASQTEEGLYIRESGADKVFVACALDATFTVRQADRNALNTFYGKCMKTDTTKFTKESVKNFNSALKKAKEILCTPSVTVTECKNAYDGLKKSYDNLATYASDTKEVSSPEALTVLIIGAVALLAAVGATIAVTNIKRNKKHKEKIEAEIKENENKE